MDLNAWLTLGAIFASPIIAVAVSLVFEQRRARRYSRMFIVRQLMVTRHLPADPNYSAAVNLVQIEFNDEPTVMAAYKEYQAAISTAADSPDAVVRFGQNAITKQTKMIFAMMRSLKLKASEADIPAEAYAAKGMIERDNLYLASLEAQVRIASALERSVSP